MSPADYVSWIRRLVGQQRILLVYVTAVVFDDERRVLVQERTDFDWPGLPGGVLEPDEDLVGCAHREVYEETGLHMHIERLVGVYSDPCYSLRYPNGDLVQPWTVCFACRAAGGEPRPDGREVRSAHFAAPAAVMPRLPHHYQHMLRDALSPTTAPAVERVVCGSRTGHVEMLRRHTNERIMLPGAVAVVHDAQGRVLAIRRSDFGTWDMPGGWCDLGETATATAVREAREETGLHVRPTRLLGVYSNPAWIVRYPNGDEVRPVGVMFACGVIGGVMRADGRESLDVAFVDPGGRGGHTLDDSPLHAIFWRDIQRPRPEPYIR